MMAGMSEARVEVQPLLSITPEARSTVDEVLSQEESADTLALWLEVNGSSNGAYTYDLYFQASADAADGDVVQYDEGLVVVIPQMSADRLVGATLDFVTDADGEGGLVIVNPNTPPSRTDQAAPASTSSAATSAKLPMYGPNSSAQPNCAGSMGFWPPWGTREPPTQTTGASRYNTPISPRVSAT